MPLDNSTTEFYTIVSKYDALSIAYLPAGYARRFTNKLLHTLLILYIKLLNNKHHPLPILLHARDYLESNY